MALRLSIGTHSVPVVVIPNAILPTASKAIPFIIGDLREFLKEFDRQHLSVVQSNTAMVTGFNAFEQDMTLFRGIMRADFVIKDSTAIVNGTITPATT